MRDEWYVARRGPEGNTRYGPVPLGQLRELMDAGRVRPEDLVWCEGMDQWRRADQCDGLSAPSRGPRDYPPDDRRGYDYGRGRGGHDPDYDDRPYRRRYPQRQSSGWVAPLVAVGAVLAVCFLGCGGLAVVGYMNSASSSSYSPVYTTTPAETFDPQDQPQFQDPNQWQPPVVQDPPFVPDPNPPGFGQPDPNPPFVPDPNPPGFGPDPNPPGFPADPNPPFVPDPNLPGGREP